MSTKKYLAIALAVLLAAGGLYHLLAGNSAGDSADNRESIPAQVPTRITFAGSSIVEEQAGKKLWELKADTIETDPEGKMAYLNNLQGVFYQQTGGTIQLAAHQAQVDMKTHDITMQGEVRITSSEGAVFTAPEARWEGNPKGFKGTGGVTLTRNDTVITGDNIQTDDKMEKAKVFGHAKVVTGGKQ